ncbi:DUF6049 family protein [Microbacterium sp. E-13]|uniref:DUF6049 family protein n=1 Tax=Microbacterium sp. E-13 TaxID=3404048 RepID=UPI003CEAC771
MTPPRAVRRPARRARRLASAAIATLAVLGGLLLPTSATAADTEPTPTPSATSSVPPGTSVFTLAPLGNGILRPGVALNVALSQQNGTDAELPATTVTLSLARTPIADREELGEWLAGEDPGTALQPVGGAAFDPVPAGGFQVRNSTVAGDDPALQGLTPGVYPLAASYEGANGTVTSRSTVIVPPEAQTEVGIGVIVPIIAAARSDGLLTADELAELTAPDGDLTRQLDSVTDTPAILAVDPAIPAAIRVLGISAPESAVEWLTRLETMQNSRFALQFGDADVTPQLQAGLPQPLGPTSLSAYMSATNFAEPTPTPTPTPAPSETPAPTPTPTADSSLPTTEELVDIGPLERSSVFWPADGTADAQIVTQLSGVPTDTTPMTVVPSATTALGADGGTVAARGRVGDAEVLVYDSDISTALGEASQSDQPWLRGAPLTTATAYLAFATEEAEGPLLVTVGRGGGRPRVNLGPAISAAFTAPSVSPRTLPAVAGSETRDVELVGTDSSGERAAAASALVADEGELGRFATILDQPSLLTGPERAGILQLLGVAWIGDETWAAALADHRAETAATLDSVALLPTSPSDLYGSSAALRFWVRNDLPYPVNLVLYTTRNNLRLDVQGETPVVATPQSNTRVEVPVQARVGRGEVTLTLQLRSPAFVAVGEPESVEVTVWADWEAVGIAALAVLVGVLLVFGVVRTVLRVRRRRKGMDAAPTGRDDAGADEASGDEPVGAGEAPDDGAER